MIRKPLDPAPRAYAPFVRLARRSARGPGVAAGIGAVADLEAWLRGPATAIDDALALVEAFAWGLGAAGVPVDRLTLHAGTLHPQLIGFGWTWRRDDGLCDELVVEPQARLSAAFLRNPLADVIGRGAAIRVDLTDPAAAARSPLTAELAAEGYTEYRAIPLAAGAQHNAGTVATRRPGGFSAEQAEALTRLRGGFALQVERHIQRRIAANALDTYLGPIAGAQVLAGAIGRGAGRPIRAVIWLSDLRGFTVMSERLPAEAVVTVMNAYFERLAGAVLDHDGEVLKFIGDGLLAVFPFETDAEAETRARAALAAAIAGLAAVDRLSAEPTPELAGVEGWAPLRSGVALHEGEVFFGNVGAPDRLDFTVIGRAVNAASRVEAMTKPLGRPVLLTEAVARRLAPEAVIDLGAHAAPGVAEPLRLFAPR